MMRSGLHRLSFSLPELAPDGDIVPLHNSLH